MSDEFWGSDDETGAGTADAPDGLSGRVPRDGSSEPLLTAPATSLLTGFATGGIVGLLEALDTGAYDADSDVEDPQALARAEAQVARAGSSRGPGGTIDEDWVAIATQVGEPLIGGLQDVVLVLADSDVAFGWDPFDPREAPAFTPPIMGTRGRSFRVLVPVSAMSAARDALTDVHPDGVTFAWDESDPAGVGTVAAASASADFGFSPATTPASVDASGRPLSDNVNLERMAGGNPTGLAVTLAIVGGLLAIGAAAFLLLRG